MLLPLLLANVAHASDDKPTPSNIVKHEWVTSLTGNPGVFFIFKKAPCQHKFQGKVAGIEKKTDLRIAVLRVDKEGMPGKIIGSGCWDADRTGKVVAYIGHKGEFNSQQNGNLVTIEWDNLSNLAYAN